MSTRCLWITQTERQWFHMNTIAFYKRIVTLVCVSPYGNLRVGWYAALSTDISDATTSVICPFTYTHNCACAISADRLISVIKESQTKHSAVCRRTSTHQRWPNQEAVLAIYRYNDWTHGSGIVRTDRPSCTNALQANQLTGTNIVDAVQGIQEGENPNRQSLFIVGSSIRFL